MSGQSDGAPAFAEWAIVEVMGRLKLAGKVTEQPLFGTAMCRVDVYPGDATEPVLTRMFSGASLYGVTIVDEATARAVAARYVQDAEPVARWELPALQAAREARATIGVDPQVDDDEGDDRDGWPGPAATMDPEPPL